MATDKDLIRLMSEKDIEQLYRNGQITLDDRSALMTEKAHDVLDELLDSKGYFGAIAARTLTHLQEGWNNFTDAARQNPDEALKPGSIAYNAAVAMWGQVQMLTSVVNAVGEVSGQSVERWAIANGTSPGVARVLNFATELGTGVVPVGGVAKSFVRGAKPILNKAGISAAKEAGEQLESVLPKQIISEGLKAEGVEIAAKHGASRLSVPQSPADAIATALKSNPDLASVLTPHAAQLSTLAKAAINGSESEQIAFARYATELFTATSGSKVHYSKEFMRLLTEWDADSIARGDVFGAMKTLAEDLAVLTPDQLTTLMIKSQSSFASGAANVWKGTKEVYINMLLPLSAVPAFVGNTISTGLAIGERALGAAFGASAKGYSWKEPFYMTKGMSLAVGDGVRAFASSFTADAAQGTATRFTTGNPDVIPGVAGRLIRTPRDTVRGMDNFFSTILKRGSYYASAIREADASGIPREELGDFILARVSNPTSAMIREADDFALKNTFQSQLGFLGNRITDAAQYGPGFFYFPLMKSAVNLAKYSWARTPGLQLVGTQLYKDIAAGGPKADAAIGQLTLSNLLGMFYWDLAREGYVTGGGPVDPALRRAWLAVNQPYSIKTENGFIPIKGNEPANTPAGMIADFVAIADKLDDPTREQLGMAIGMSIMRNVVNNTWFSTGADITDALQAVQEGKLTEGAKRALLAPVMTVATGGPLVGRIRMAIDPVTREARGMLDEWIARTPGFSESQPAVRNIYGNVQVPPKAVGNSWFGLLRPLVPSFREHSADAVELEGNRLSVKGPYFGWSVGGRARDDSDISEMVPGEKPGVPLTAQQRDTRIRLYRNMLYDEKDGIQARLLNSPTYQKQTVDMQRTLFEGLLRKYWSASEAQLMVKEPEIGKRVLLNRGEAVLPLVQPERRPAIVEETLNAVRLFENMPQAEIDNILRYDSTRR